MKDGDLTCDSFLQRLNIRDVLVDAEYHLNRRDGLRYPSYVRSNSDGRRIHGDKFIMAQQGKCCFHIQQQKIYNIISFIKGHPHFFTEYHAGMSPDRLVNLVCNRLLNILVTERKTRMVSPKRDVRPFDTAGYGVHKFNPQSRKAQKKFCPYFRDRGVDLYTQYAFHRHFYLTTKHRGDSATCMNLSFPLTLPRDGGAIVGLEERERARMDRNSSYKSKAAGNDSSEGLQITSPARTSPTPAKHIYWFGSTYNAMAYYQLHQAQNKDLRKTVFISTGGAPSQQQFKGAIKAAPHASYHLCFDHDHTGQVYAIHFALTHTDWNLSTCLSQAGRLIVQNDSEDYSQYEIKLKPFDFEKITAILGMNDAE